MKTVVRVGTLIALLSGASSAEGQGASIDAQCRGGTPLERITQDACQKAVDLFAFLAPQLGAALAGGNAVSGEHSTLGGPGRISIGIRVNAIQAHLPRVDAQTPAITGAVASVYGLQRQLVPVPTIDAALGAFRGVPLGGTTAFGVDALLTLSVLPTVSTPDLEVKLPDGPVKLGFGARVSLVRENVFMPGVTFTYLRRDLPRLAIAGSPSSDEIAVNDFQIKTSAWRGLVGKNVGPVAVTAGFGQDTYETSALAEVHVRRGGLTTTAGPIAAVQQLTRDNFFGSVALSLPVLSIVGEMGRVSNGALTTYNTFSRTRADAPLDYASLGLRFRF